ncbi:hypothetical protein GDO78_020403 [Eleutherodactylus coqui]|uniref:Uncharacterized protein n=1 Tax=Eleutherodactylus coqui TaxID=57060 RepID=A0A8J6B6P8_ELECQ|nr:hypothetical protein GDO78_020403 [Eleutherodactylus coqui]
MIFSVSFDVIDPVTYSLYHCMNEHLQYLLYSPHTDGGGYYVSMCVLPAVGDHWYGCAVIELHVQACSVNSVESAPRQDKHNNLRGYVA